MFNPPRPTQSVKIFIRLEPFQSPVGIRKVKTSARLFHPLPDLKRHSSLVEGSEIGFNQRRAQQVKTHPKIRKVKKPKSAKAISKLNTFRSLEFSHFWTLQINARHFSEFVLFKPFSIGTFACFYTRSLLTPFASFAFLKQLAN